MPPTRPGLRTTPYRTIALAAALVAVASLVVVGAQVTDWKRDFTTNVAETRPDAADSLLRPLRTPASLEAAATAVIEAAAGLPRWSHVRRTDQPGQVELAFTRTTRLFRFVDDVTVWIDDRGDYRLVRARSASRVGKADLGQNPRNLRELFRAMRAASPTGQR